jgi:hypothetical protein
MMDSLSAAAGLLLPIAQAVFPPLRRVHRKRQAGRMPFGVDYDLLERGLDETLDRLRGGDVDDTWWQNLLDRIGQRFIAPDFLRMPALQEWLADERVQQDVKALARGRIMGSDTDDPGALARLRQAYAESTGEAEQRADGPIEVVLAILAAGYLASIDPKHRALAGLIQTHAQEDRAGFQRMGERFDTVNRRLDEIGPDHYVVETHSERAEHDLRLILKRWSLFPRRARQEIVALVQCVTDGDLQHAKHSVRAEVYYWAARWHATQRATVPAAKNYLEQLRQIDPTINTRIIDALILEMEGDVDSALQMLRDLDTADGMASLFVTLLRARGAEVALAWFDAQPARDHASFLTGLGWSNVAVCLATMDRWEEAADRLAAAREHREDWPDLVFVEGVINAALLLPAEWRQYALEMNLFHPEIRPIEGAGADQRRARAKACFEEAVTLLTAIDQPGRAQAARDWCLWLRLTDPTPDVVDEARQEVQEGMQEGQRAVDLVPFARRFGIEFDKDPLTRYLEQRKRTGGLYDRELMAEFFLAELTLHPRERAEYLEREEDRLSRVVSKATLAGKRIEALVQDGQTVRARSLLEARREDFVQHDYERLRALINSYEGNDPRTQLEELYRQTDDLIDLQNLVAHLEGIGDWQALQPLYEELFRRVPTVDNALRLIESVRRNPQAASHDILTFLEQHQEMIDRSPELASAKAWALLHMGRLKAAEAVNHTLLEARNDHNDLLLDINLALQSGNWERFPAIIERTWSRREELAPSLLMRLALLAAEADATASRALELAKLAASKASDDPEILLSAYMLAVQLGCEEEVGVAWLARAFELSSDEGPVRQVDPRTIVEEMMPRWRERIRKIEQELLRGKLPLHDVVYMLNQPLSRLLIDIPCKNAEQHDGRRRTLVPIVSGARQTAQIRPEWTVGLDVTSLMVLGHLDLLRRAIEALRCVALAPETLVFLLNERRLARFHQPSLIKEAEDIRELIDQSGLKVESALPQPPTWLVNEVGRGLAELLEAAWVANGRVVHPYPIHKLQTFMEREAELGAYAELVLSTRAFANILSVRGIIDAQTHERACRFLQVRDNDPNPDADPSLLDRPLYLNDLAITYLKKAGLLQAACHSGLNLLVHPSTQAHQAALIRENREGNRLATTLDDIRVTLREALETGKAIFIPRHTWHEEATQLGWLYQAAPTLAQILRDVSPCHAVCIDDRFANRHGTLTDETGHTVPLVCVLDLLHHLEVQGVMNAEEKYGAFHKLRQAGYALVPVDPDELERYVCQTGFDQEGYLIENAEMRLIRQTLMRLRSLDMVELSAEVFFLQRLERGCVAVIHRLWTDEAVPVKQAAILSHWIWGSVAPLPLDWARTLPEPLYQSDIPEACAQHLFLLLQPLSLVQLTRERREAFCALVERTILEALLPANADLVDRLAVLVRANIERLSEEFSDDESRTDC